MNEIQIISMCLGSIGCILLILGYLIKFKDKIQLIAGVSKNDDKIKDKNAFASLVGGNVLILGIIFFAGAIGIFICPDYKDLIELILLLSLLITGILVFIKSKKYIS